VYQDTKGYIWFGTFEGLSRFDGYRFVNYDTRDGFNQPIVNYVAEDRQGQLWIATNGGGISRLIDSPHDRTNTTLKKFISFPVGDSPASNRVNRMMFDGNNKLWCLTDAGLYRADTRDPTLKFYLVAASNYACKEMVEDKSGRMWFGLGDK